LNFKISAELNAKNGENIRGFFAQTTASFYKKFTIILVYKRKAVFHHRKLAKNVIITSIPE
jgi:hypothetical protein